MILGSFKNYFIPWIHKFGIVLVAAVWPKSENPETTAVLLVFDISSAATWVSQHLIKLIISSWWCSLGGDSFQTPYHMRLSPPLDLLIIEEIIHLHKKIRKGDTGNVSKTKLPKAPAMEKYHQPRWQHDLLHPLKPHNFQIEGAKTIVFRCNLYNTEV